MPTINKEHKDRLFSFLFGSEANKEWTLSLYNAVNETCYTDSEEIQFTTIEDVVYMGMKNNLSFILFYVMNIYGKKRIRLPICRDGYRSEGPDDRHQLWEKPKDDGGLPSTG